jgi:DUF4097 and DUF4098 domain-containing protein YvlB
VTIIRFSLSMAAAATLALAATPASAARGERPAAFDGRGTLSSAATRVPGWELAPRAGMLGGRTLPAASATRLDATPESRHELRAQDPNPRIVIREGARRVGSGAYQGRDRGREETERFSRRIKIGRDGRVSVQNIAGDITVTGGSGDEVSIEAVKRTHGDQGQLQSVHIDVDEHTGRVDVRTTHTGRNDRVSVDYTITVPSEAGVELRSISGTLKISNVRGAVRLDTVSGDVTTSDTPRLESAKSVSGDVSLTGAAADGDLSAASVSGNVTLKGVKARGLDLGSVSGDILVTDVTCERLGAKSVSGNLEYSGSIEKSGRYDLNTHSGNVRLTLNNPSGFELNANSFSGTIRSEFQLTIGGDAAARDRDRDTGRRRDAMSSHTIHATYGDGSATLTVRTFSGNITIAKR